MDNIRIIDKNNIKDFIFPNKIDGDFAKKHLVPIIKEGTKKYIRNVDTELCLLSIDDLVLPITINNKEYSNSYVVSPYTHYVTYCIEELKELNDERLSKLLKPVLYLLGSFLKLTSINKVIHINNWMVSTNLYPAISREQVNRITKFLSSKYPNHALVFKSIYDLNNPLFDSLKNNNYHFIASRQIYFARKLKELRNKEREHITRDMKMIKKNSLNWVDIDENYLDKTSTLEKLYNFLYLNKYSQNNPQFSEELLKLAIKEKLFTFKGLEMDNKLIGFYGYFERNGMMTTPLVGYDTNLPKELGLYRILTSDLFTESENKGLVLHMSSGAASFKRNRGCLSSIEYNAVYLKHLPFYRKTGWLLLKQIINKVAIPLLEKKEL